MSKHVRLFVVSGPSGVGKGTLVARVREQIPDLGLTVSATTRKPRVGEVDGVSYHFLSDDEFDSRVEAGEFLEWANVFGKRYGTLVSEVRRVLDGGSSVILEIDVQGGLQVKEKLPEAVLIFIEPPSAEELERRLRTRATDSAETIERRLKEAAHELELGKRYDEHIVNDELELAVEELAATIERYETEIGDSSSCQ